MGKKLGNGSFGTIFEGTCRLTKRKVAIKLEAIKMNRMCNLMHEFQILERLQGEGKSTTEVFLSDCDLLA